MSNCGPRKEQNMDISMSGLRTQVKIAKDGFELCPDTSQNRKDGFDLCPDTNQNRKIWHLCLMDKFVLWY